MPAHSIGLGNPSTYLVVEFDSGKQLHLDDAVVSFAEGGINSGLIIGAVESGFIVDEVQVKVSDPARVMAALLGEGILLVDIATGKTRVFSVAHQGLIYRDPFSGTYIDTATSLN